jgi:SAM-dependent methyltransferase
VDEAFLQRFFPGEPLHIDAYFDELAAHLPPSGRVLDLGCGANTTLDRFRGPGLEAWGADFQAHPELAHADRFRLLRADGGVPFPDGSFDLVASLWVLEHVDAPAAFLAEVSRVLRPGGWLVAHSVSAMHYVTWIRRAFDLLPHETVQAFVRRLYRRAEHDTFPTRYRLNTPPQLRRCARRVGLRLARLRHLHDKSWYFHFSPALRRAAIVCDWLLEKAAPGWGRLYFTAVFQKPPAAVPAVPARRAA